MQIKYDGPLSANIGRKIMESLFILDDSNSTGGTGGVISILIGTYGSGKSTLLTLLAENSVNIRRGTKVSYAYHIRNNLSLKHFKAEQSTVIWRARDLDSFGSLIPENWKERFPDSNPKPLKLFVHRNDIKHITFFTYKNGQPVPVPNLPEPIIYNSCDDVIDNLQENGINIVLEEQNYRLSPRMCAIVQQSKAEYVGDAGKEDCAKDEPEPKQRGRGRPPKRINDYSQHAVPAACMQFDLIASIMAKRAGEPTFFIADEIESFLPATVSDIHWWMSRWLTTDMMRDFRKSNLTFVGSTHGWTFLHDVFYKRSEIRLMLKGTEKSKYTRIYQQSIFDGLEKGFVVPEMVGTGFGIAHFPPIPHPIQVRIDGLANSSRSLTDEKAIEIREVYHKIWEKLRIPQTSIEEFAEDCAEYKVG